MIFSTESLPRNNFSSNLAVIPLRLLNEYLLKISYLRKKDTYVINERKNKVFTFVKSEENRYWHIVADNSFVLDIEYVLFEDDNTVIAWDENGVVGQYWQVEDIGNNVVEIKSFEPEHNLTWGRHVEDEGSVTQRTLIT